jgi:hypothetical protein
MKTPVMVTVLALACSGVGAAQSPQRSAFLGGGFEAIGVGAAYERAWGLSLQAGHVWQHQRAGVRLAASYVRRNREVNTSGYYASRTGVIGFSGELTYDLTATRFRPYAIGGLGLYRVSGTSITGSETRVVNRVTPAVIGGLGFRYRLGGAELFTEARAHGLTHGQGWGGAFMPVTFGIRFD